MGDGPPRSKEESDVPRAGLDDTIPASEPPLDADGNPMRGSRQSIPPPPEPRYRHGIELGRGGMGRVVEAFDTQLGRTVALKEVLPKGASVERRFLREVQITARLEHPAIVPLYDSGTTPDGRPFYVMRRVTGRPLDELITRARGFGERLTLLPNVLAAIDAVAHAHKRGVIHRDLKPANILVGEHGETVVIDWGLAKVVGEEDIYSADPKAPVIPVASDSLQTQVGSVFGTPGFMAPEQARGEELGPHTDVYALGATLYQVLAGSPAHSGNSATEVLGKTLKHDVIPLGEIAEGTPPELIAIVDKALAFDEKTRYPDASALAEDVRRFLAGQLVAAHRYTSRQRLARFARKHRTALAVAALATVAVAALAWFSVHRIVTERDRAEEASARALQEKRAAEAARDDLAEQNDTLLITQVAAILETNPTEALAVLKQLPPTSKRIPEARGLAQAAVARGVWTAMQSSDQPTVRLVVSPDGQQLLQLARDGQLRVWDLERRRLAIARPFALEDSAVWISGGRLLLYGSKSQSEILDPAANVSAPIALGMLSHAEASADGTRLLLTDVAGSSSLYDVASQRRTALLGGKRAYDSAISPDGSWVAAGDGKTLVIYDGEGRELTRHQGGNGRIVARANMLALSTRTRVVECRLGPQPTCMELPLDLRPTELIVDLAYRGEELDIMITTGALMAWNGKTVFERARIPDFAFPMTPVADDLLLVPTSDGHFTLIGSNIRGTLRMPHTVASLRVAGRPGMNRLVVAGIGVILMLDLGAVVPKRLVEAANEEPLFVDDHTALLFSSTQLQWSWLDLETRKRVVIPDEIFGMPQLIDQDPPSGRMLAIHHVGEGSKLVLLRKGSTTMTILATGPRLWGRLIPGDTVVFGSGDQGAVIAAIGDEKPREVLRLDGRIAGAVGLGPRRYAAVSTKGELVRADLVTGSVERISIDPQSGASGVAADPLGRVIVIARDRLLLWDGGVHEMARFDKPVLQVMPTEAGEALVVLADNELQRVTIEPRATPRRLLEATKPAPRFSHDGRTIIAAGNGFQISVIELPGDARWDLPRLFPAQWTMALSPSGRRVIQAGFGTPMLWDLPTAGPDLPAWLDEQTNAVKEHGQVLAWPWQLRTVPP